MGRLPAAETRRRELLSSTEAAAKLGVCERTLRRYIKSGRIQYHRLPGGHYRIAEDAIRDFWAEHDRLRATRHLARASAQPSHPLAARPSTRRPALGREADREDYDLSDEHLAELRVRFAAKHPR
jgi:excisionase family DNA binding protein